jgi:hypothetical protein
VASLIAGVAALNVIFLAVGYCLLAPVLKGLSASTWPTFAGLALLVGAASVGVTLCVLAVFGFRTGLSAFATVAGVLATAGALAAVFVPSRRLQVIRFRIVPPRPERLGAIFGSAAAAFVAGMCLLTVFAAFRSTPWLNDAWTFWLPKGLMLSGHGLDERPFAQTDLYVGVANPDYPLWWSVVGGLEMDFVGRVDLRALNAEIAILLAALVASVARLLWGRVRPWIVWMALLVLVISAELLRHTQSGGADVPLAVYLALAVLAGTLWLTSGEAFFLAVAAVAAAAAASIKVEGAPQLALLVAFPALLVWRTVRWRSVALVGVLAAAWATSVPWLVWKALHSVESEFSLRNGLDPGYLADRADRVWPSAHFVATSLVGRDWPLIVPLFLALTILGVILERRPLWLVPAAAFGVCFAFWVWTYWAGSIPLDFWLQTSAYRVVDGLLLAVAVTIPLMAERLVNVLSARRFARRSAMAERESP